MPNYVVLDLETRESFQDIGSWDPSKLTISLVGLYDAATGKESTFRLEELADVEARLSAAPQVIGYNLFGFDYHVLKSAFAARSASSLDPFVLPTVDVFDHLQRALGFRPKLDDVAAATLGRRKSGDGLQAIRLYQQGAWDALSRYCLDDVRITKDIYEYGLAHGHVKIFTRRSLGEGGPMRDGRIANVKAAWQPVPEQARMF